MFKEIVYIRDTVDQSISVDLIRRILDEDKDLDRSAVDKHITFILGTCGVENAHLKYHYRVLDAASHGDRAVYITEFTFDCKKDFLRFKLLNMDFFSEHALQAEEVSEHVYGARYTICR